MSRLRSINWLRLLLAVIDLCLLNLGVLGGYWVRFEGHVDWRNLMYFYLDAGFVLPGAVLVFFLFGLYHRIWRFASSEAVLAIAGAVTTYVIVVWAVLNLRESPACRPSILATIWLVWLLLVGASRFGWRVLREYQSRGPLGKGERRRVLIYGAGEAGAALSRRIEHSRESPVEVVGFVDDDPQKRNMLVRRSRVLGNGPELAELVESLRIAEVLIAIPSLGGEHLRRIVELCRAAKVPAKVLPSRLETMDAPVSLSQLRQVQLDDLLSRDPADFPIDTCGEYLRGRCVLVTGAGGSIGAEIARQAVRFAPRKLVLFGRGENRIHEIYHELRRHAPELQIIPVIANFAVPGVADEVIRTHRPEVIFHAGAHKHVYLMEVNVSEAVRNNVLGTQLLLDAAGANGVERFVLISTDKAVQPTSVMGATKRLCEVLGACAAARDEEMQVTTVRFGNVLGTNGSVLQLFESQLAAGRPLTITHPEATRYFMTCEEAALLVIDAAGQDCHGGAFILDMGQPVSIKQLAAELVALAGRDPEDDGNYEYIGLLPGEKLHEELSNPWEELERVSSYLLRVRGPLCRTDLNVERVLSALEMAMARGDDEVRRVLFRRIAGLSPSQKVLLEGE